MVHSNCCRGAVMDNGELNGTLAMFITFWGVIILCSLTGLFAFLWPFPFVYYVLLSILGVLLVWLGITMFYANGIGDVL